MSCNIFFIWLSNYVMKLLIHISWLYMHLTRKFTNFKQNKHRKEFSEISYFSHANYRILICDPPAKTAEPTPLWRLEIVRFQLKSDIIDANVKITALIKQSKANVVHKNTDFTNDRGPAFASHARGVRLPFATDRNR